MTKAELSIGFRKKATGKPSITYQQALDQALCFGWIDGVRRRIDDASYTIRFTPRKARSIWSAVNRARYAELLAAGKVAPAGEAAFARHDPKRAPSYSFENEERPLDEEHESTFRASTKAWKFFHDQAPSYQRAARWWIRSAKRPETRARRLALLIEDSAHGRRLSQFSRPKKK